jgi:predicted nucleotide-binding protein
VHPPSLLAELRINGAAVNSFNNLPPDQLRVFLHLYARWDQYWGGVETSTLVSHLGIDGKNLKPLLEALSAAGHVEFGYDIVTLKESVHNELKKAGQAHAMSSLQQGTLTLGMPASAALVRLNKQMELGRKIADADLDKVDAETYPENATTWYKETADLLVAAFQETWPRDGFGIMIEASTVKGWARIGKMHSAKDAVGIAVAWMQEIVDRVTREHSTQKSEGGAAMPAPATPRARVFIVHGHDKEAREAVARAIDKLGAKSVILKEEPEGGIRTLIEKVEQSGSSAQYAVAILTPDDFGCSAAELRACTTAQDKVDKLKPRPRQNVLLELGYFWGKLGRNKMCVVHRSDREAILKDVSDWQGIVCIEMDANDAWKHKLGKELIAAGIKVDLNNV